MCAEGELEGPCEVSVECGDNGSEGNSSVMGVNSAIEKRKIKEKEEVVKASEEIKTTIQKIVWEKNERIWKKKLVEESSEEVFEKEKNEKSKMKEKEQKTLKELHLVKRMIKEIENASVRGTKNITTDLEMKNNVKILGMKNTNKSNTNSTKMEMNSLKFSKMKPEKNVIILNHKTKNVKKKTKSVTSVGKNNKIVQYFEVLGKEGKTPQYSARSSCETKHLPPHETKAKKTELLKMNKGHPI